MTKEYCPMCDDFKYDEKECEQSANHIWNVAIEKAVEICKHSGYAEQIRKLKK